MAYLFLGLSVLAFAAFFARRLLVYLHLFQQEEYDNRRFPGLLLRKRLFDRRATLAAVLAGLTPLVPGLPAWGPHVVAAAGLAVVAVIETDPRTQAKKKLAMTARAKRIYGVALALAVPVALAIAVGGRPVLWLVPAQLAPLFLVLANLILAPHEARIQRRYWTEAASRLVELHPLVVGVTGSFGKSTVKHILGHILGMAEPTLVTPGSINTPMGIARIVREKLQRAHKYFVVEMGAYGPGSIARLCELAPPAHGVVTALGPAHYERFKSIEAVARTKFELGRAVEKTGGRLVVATPCLAVAPAAEFCAAHPGTVILAGPDESAACRLLGSRQSPAGTEVDLAWQDKTYHLRAPIYGAHQAQNLCTAFAAACALGIAPETAALAVASVPQVTHRLEVKRQPGDVTLIDDAYNANPEGFASALGVLSLLQTGSGRRILVTPGIVELGALHDSVHERLGTLAADHADVLLPVVPERIAAFTRAFATAAPGRPVIPCANFAAASAWMEKNLAAGDVVLLENDLPDLYETRIKL